MRIISFSKKWDKLQQPEFTTFRFPRRDKNWYIGETVQVFYKSRSPQREKLGIAEIIKSEVRKIATGYVPYRPTENEAKEDGFLSLLDMNTYFRKTYGSHIFEKLINKLTLKWVANPEGR